MNDRLARIEVIVSDWASDDSDAIDDLDALCQIAEVLGIEVEARTPASVEAPGTEVQCEACDAGYRLVTEGLGAGIHYNDERGGRTWGVCRKLTARAMVHSQPPEQQSPRVCVECGHNNLAFGVCQEQVDVGNLTPIQMVELHQEFWDAGILRCGCKCIFPD